MPNIHIKTYGCQMNHRDTQSLTTQLLHKGYTITPNEHQADIILLNTCSIRDQAEQKAIHKLQNLTHQKNHKQKRPILGILGCVAQNRGQQLLDQLPDLDLILGTQKIHHTPQHLNQILKHQHKICDTAPEPQSQNKIKHHPPTQPNTHTPVTAYISIMQGCNQHCTYCIVPHTRGHERSRPIQHILHETNQLTTNGTKEITLLGQIVTNYAKRDIPKKNGNTPFVQLLQQLHQNTQLQRIRFTSPHPKGYGPDLIQAYQNLPKLCPSAHIPLQSGSNRILKKMHRGYTTQHYLHIIQQLRAQNPNIGITTDLIVAHPGETDHDFQQTLHLTQQIQFDNAYTYKYSPRQGTPAASDPQQIPPHTAQKRHQKLLQTITQIGTQRYQQHLHKTHTILVEGPSHKNPQNLQGRTPCNKIVIFKGKPHHIGKLIQIKINKTGTFTLYGNPTN